MKPRVFADDRGVWRQDGPRRPSGISWDEVFCVGGYQLDGVTEVHTCVVLDWSYGEFMELYDDWAGFPQVISAITERLPGIDPEWFQRIERLSKKEPAIEVWRRA